MSNYEHVDVEGHCIVETLSRRLMRAYTVDDDGTTEPERRIAELEDVLIGAEIVIRMLAPAGQETTLETIRRALRRPT